MLLNLKIKNFVIIDDLTIDFQEGMTVLTGETGAGKSIIIDALGLIAGGRGSNKYIRHGEESLHLEGEFFIAQNEKQIKKILTENKIDYQDQKLLVQRHIYSSGRNICRINGHIVTVAILKSVGSELVDIQGQNEHQQLMRPESHLDLLDSFSGQEFNELKKDYQEEYDNYRLINKEYNDWQINEQEAAQRLDILSFQIKEIQNADLKENEEKELEEERLALLNYQKIVEALSGSYDLLHRGEVSTLDKIGEAMQALERIEDISSSYKELSEKLSSSYYQLEESASRIFDFMSELEYNEERQNEIEARLNLIQQLKRKYGADIPEILNFLKDSVEEREKLEERESTLGTLKIKLEETGRQVLRKGKDLSALRRKIAGELEKNVNHEFQELYMEEADFKVKFSKQIKDFTIHDAKERGLDTAYFYISTNPGQPLNPLEEVASGGELSRIMLALKTIFSEEQNVSSIIFDEVDTGVSGRVAQAIADKIYSISRSGQVLCITHLPQVAAVSDHHLYISKIVQDNKTRTQVTTLNEEEKVAEVAQMLAGEDITPSIIDTARELRHIK